MRDLTIKVVRGATFIQGNLEGADLALAHLKGADLRGAYLAGSFVGGAHLVGVLSLANEQITSVYTNFDLGQHRMRKLKTALDPANRMNPGKILLAE